MIKAVFCDLDGTLFTNSKTINQPDKDMINTLEDKSILFVPCSGRVPYNVRKVLSDVSPYMIGSNGTSILYNGQYLKYRPYPKDMLKILVDIGIKYDVFMHIQTEDKLYYYHNFKNSKDLLGAVSIDIEAKEAYEIVEKEDVFKVVYVPKDKTILPILEKELLSAYPNSEIFMADNFMEMNEKGQSKALAIREFCQYYKIDLNDCLAIGDGHNDYEMLKTVGHSASVSNGDEGIKKICEYVSPFSNENGGVADILKYFLEGENV